MHYFSMLCQYNMSLNSTLHEDLDNGAISIYTSKLDPGADICLGLAILFVGKCLALIFFGIKI